jgi:hypothetical protein
MRIETEYYQRCIKTLEKAHALLLKANPDDIEMVKILPKRLLFYYQRLFRIPLH